MSRIQNEITAAMRGFSNADGKLKADFLFPASFAGFQGHFENNPVLPGICKIQAVIAVCEKHFGRSFRLESIRNAKYFAPVLPDQEITVQFQPETADNGGLSLKASVTKESVKIALLQLTLKPL